MPNLAIGTQQIILGRYLPPGPGVPPANEQSGEVIVSGTLAGRQVKYSAQVSLNDAENGNSFIPRLWARMYLDTLLEQGDSPAVKDEIIALSEEYHIITPHTSLLVLESDADRERFGVKRRFQMRDGEKFFAQGRENANWELIQQQMKRAGTWRLGLRRQVLQQLSGLGREMSVMQGNWDNHLPMSGTSGGMMGRMGGIGGGGMNLGMVLSTYGGETTLNADGIILSDDSRTVDSERAANKRGQLESDQFAGDLPVDAPFAPPGTPPSMSGLEAGGEPMNGEVDAAKTPPSPAPPESDFDLAPSTPETGKDLTPPDPLADSTALSLYSDQVSLATEGERYSVYGPVAGRPIGMFWRNRWGRPTVDYSWLNNVFPALPAPPTPPREPKQPWSAEARKIARSLLRTEQLTGARTACRSKSPRKSSIPAGIRSPAGRKPRRSSLPTAGSLFSPVTSPRLASPGPMLMSAAF